MPLHWGSQTPSTQRIRRQLIIVILYSLLFGRRIILESKWSWSPSSPTSPIRPSNLCQRNSITELSGTFTYQSDKYSARFEVCEVCMPFSDSVETFYLPHEKK